MFDLDLAYPLTLGLVAAFNPCGFAMLPAYVSYFLGLESDQETNPARNIMRALVVSATLTLGFMAVFGVIGVLASTVINESTISRRVPYATVAFGVLMVPLGLAMIRGYEPKLNIRRLEAGGKNGQLPSIFLFGVSYAVVSISCTIGLFLTAVIDSFDNDGIIDGTAGYLAYAAGMGLVILVLSIGVALARNSVAAHMRRFLPYVSRVSGVMLMLSGLYLVIYGWWEIQVLRGNITDNPIVELGTAVQDRINNWVTDVGPTRLALAVAVIVGALLTGALTSTMANRTERRLVRGGFVTVYALIEIVRYQFDLLVLPAIRTIFDAPARVLHWFTDVGRWPVLFEVLLAAILVTVGWTVIRRRFTGKPHEPRVTSDPVGVGSTSADSAD